MQGLRGSSSGTTTATTTGSPAGECVVRAAVASHTGYMVVAGACVVRHHTYADNHATGGQDTCDHI
jgi:hypothetical protein